MNIRRGLKLTLAISCVAVGLIFLGNSHKSAPIIVDLKLLRSGDLVFLHGTSFRGSIVRLLETGSFDYSHVGLIVFDSNIPYVIHANPEQSYGDKVAKEKLSAVIDPKRASGAAFYRVTNANLEDIKQACVVARQFEVEKKPFDHEFNLLNSEKIYCTELVWLAYLSSGIDLRGSWDSGSRKYLLPADIIGSGAVARIVDY